MDYADPPGLVWKTLQDGKEAAVQFTGLKHTFGEASVGREA